MIRAKTIIAALLISFCGSCFAAFDGPRISTLETSSTFPNGAKFVMTGMSNAMTLSASEQSFTFTPVGVGSLRSTDMITTGCKYHIHLRGNTTGVVAAVNTILLKLKTGSTILAAGTSFSVAALATTNYFEINIYVMVDTPGSSGSVSTVGYGQGVFTPARTTVTLNTTTDQPLTLTATGGVGLLGYATVQIDEAEMDRVY